MSSNGTGNAANQPATRTGWRPRRSDSGPAATLVRALVTPKATMKVRAAVTAVRWNTCVASSGRTVRSCPSMPPTSALTPTRRLNWARFARSPSAMARGLGAAAVIRWRSAASRSARRPNRRPGPPGSHDPVPRADSPPSSPAPQDPPKPGGKWGRQRNGWGAGNMARGEIHKRAEVDHDRTRRQLAAKFVDREPCKLRSFHAIETRAALIHAPQPEEIGRIGAKAVKERMDKCLLGGRGKQRTFVPLSPERGGPP